MTKTAFRVEGRFQMGRAKQDFALEIVADNEAAAREHAFTDLGSRHGASRREIQITKVSPVSSDEASSVTRRRLQQ